MGFKRKLLALALAFTVTVSASPTKAFASEHDSSMTIGESGQIIEKEDSLVPGQNLDDEDTDNQTDIEDESTSEETAEDIIPSDETGEANLEPPVLEEENAALLLENTLASPASQPHGDWTLLDDGSGSKEYSASDGTYMGTVSSSVCPVVQDWSPKQIHIYPVPDWYPNGELTLFYPDDLQQVTISLHPAPGYQLYWTHQSDSYSLRNRINDLNPSSWSNESKKEEAKKYLSEHVASGNTWTTQLNQGGDPIVFYIWKGLDSSQPDGGKDDDEQIENRAIRLLKTDEEDAPLSGATFQFQSDSNEFETTGTTNSNGEIEWNDLPAGEGYTLTELAAPDGYLLPESSHASLHLYLGETEGEDRITQNGLNASLSLEGSTAVVTIVNYPKPADPPAPVEKTIYLRKIDADSGESLDGAVFTVAETASGNSNEYTSVLGQLEILVQAPGSYLFSEKKAPQGYAEPVPAESSFQVDVDSSGAVSIDPAKNLLDAELSDDTITVKNKKSEAPAPEPNPEPNPNPEPEPKPEPKPEPHTAQLTVFHHYLDADQTPVWSSDGAGKELGKDFQIGQPFRSMSYVESVPSYNGSPYQFSRIDFYENTKRSETTPETITIAVNTECELHYYYVPEKTNTPDNPIDPEKPVVPDNPVDPDQPVVPDNPIDPEKPVVPDNPTDPEKPVVPDNPTDPEKPVVPDNPIDPEKPVVPDNPIDPEKPVVPDNPIDPEKPVVPDNPTDPEKPVVPDNPTDPEKPVVPDNPVTPDKPIGPDRPVYPVIPVWPVNPDTPDPPVTPRRPSVEREPSDSPSVPSSPRTRTQAPLDDGTTTIPDDTIPLGPLPATTDPNALITILDDDAPLGKLPKTGKNHTASTVSSIGFLTALAGALSGLFRRKKQH